MSFEPTLGIRMFERLPVLFRSAMYALRGGFLIRPLAIAMMLGISRHCVRNLFSQRRLKHKADEQAIPFGARHDKLADLAANQMVHWPHLGRRARDYLHVAARQRVD